MRTLIYLLALSLTAAGCSMKQEEAIKLVTNGESGYTIIIPLNAAPSEVRAATFLNEHIRKISGVDLPVVSSNGPLPEQCIHISTTTEIETGDGFSIKTDGDNLIIKGGNQRGCIYAVSELLERYLGVRHYSPGYVVIPQQKSIALPAIDITGSSPNSYRNVNGAFALNADYKDFNRLYHTDDMFAKGYFVHTFNKLVPWESWFESHPEYFSYMNGKRIIDQLCLTNPDVLRLTIEKLKAEMALQPDKVFWSVSQGDNFSHCQCDNCSKIIEEEASPAGPIIHFVNSVAEEFPDKVISTLAYQYSRKAPKNIRPRDNVQIMLCTIELNRSLPIATDQGSKSFLTDLQDWGKTTNHIFLWDYTVDFAHSISPFPNLHTLQPNIRLFVENNVREHFQQTNTGTGHEFSELKAYLLSKLLWNPDANAEEIIREFTDGYYGEGGKWIRKYITSLEKELRKSGERLDIYGPPTNHQNTFLSEKNIKRYSRFLDKAEEAASGDSDHHLHVRTATMPLQYAIMEIGKNDMFGERGWYQEIDGDFIVRTEMTSMLESFYQTSIDCKSAPVNESGLTPEDYYRATRRFIEVQVKGNLAFRKKVISDPLPAAKYSGGDLAYLTNGVRGANDFKVHWLGWEAQNFSLTLDLEELVDANTIEISTFWEQKSWILHPASVTCLISEDGSQYSSLGKQAVEGDQRHEDVTRLFSFDAAGKKYRFVKFEVEGTLRLFDWHPSAGGGSWVFVDEIVVRCTTAPVEEEHPYIHPADPAVSQKLAEWHDWKFGVLIHWGPYSQWGVVESWSLCPEDEPWCERRGQFADDYYTYTREYEKLPETFNPVAFNPTLWAEACSAAGMKYVVFTTKHHDGFAMFDTKQSDYKITGPNSAFAKNHRSNVVKEVFTAFGEKGMGIGAYFSKPDWHNDDYWWPYFPVFDRNVNYDPEKYPEKWNSFKQFTYNQIEELMTEYGEIDILWLDGGWVRPAGTLTEESRPWLGKNQWVQDVDIPAIAAMARSHQPGLLVVDRTVHSEYENYRTPEQQIPDEIPSYPWESCITLGDSWYSTGDGEKYKSSAWAIHTLVKIVAMGGNFLLGIGPNHTGEMVPEVYERLAEIGKWMDINSEAIYNTKPLPPYHEEQLYFTRSNDGKTIYAIYLRPEDGTIPETLELPGHFAAQSANATLHGYSTQLKIEEKAGKYYVKLPAEFFANPDQPPAIVIAVTIVNN